MDLAKTLIRSVARGFYPDTKHVLVIDALMVHSALPNEDLALLLGMQQKDLRKLCGKLKEDRLLAVHSRQEIREGQQRPINKDYYYIDFHATIDAIKYRVFHLTQKIKDLYMPSEERKDYYCLRCKAQYTTLEVLDSVGPMGFICHRCGSNLEERDDRNAGTSVGNEQQSKLATQFERLLKLLRQIDAEDIPANDFETAFALAVPVQKNELINPTRITGPLKPGGGPPVAVKGLNTKATTSLEVSLTTAAEKLAAEEADAARAKAEADLQNSVPVWHTKSTVTGEATALGLKLERQLLREKPAVKPQGENSDKAENTVINDQLTEYYNRILKNDANEGQQGRDEDQSSDEDDEEEDEFEDIGARPSGDATPSSTPSTSANEIKTGSFDKDSRKRGSDSVSGDHGWNISNPITVPDDGDSPAAKRVKLEDQNNGVGGGEPGPEDAEAGDSVEDEEDDFEDAL